MDATLEKLEKEAFSLTSADRARLAMDLIKSLDNQDDTNAEELWLQEPNAAIVNTGKEISQPGPPKMFFGMPSRNCDEKSHLSTPVGRGDERFGHLL
jgi:hypothetical protein